MPDELVLELLPGCSLWLLLLLLLLLLPLLLLSLFLFPFSVYFNTQLLELIHPSQMFRVLDGQQSPLAGLLLGQWLPGSHQCLPVFSLFSLMLYRSLSLLIYNEGLLLV